MQDARPCDVEQDAGHAARDIGPGRTIIAVRDQSGTGDAADSDDEALRKAARYVFKDAPAATAAADPEAKAAEVREDIFPGFLRFKGQSMDRIANIILGLTEQEKSVS